MGPNITTGSVRTFGLSFSADASSSLQDQNLPCLPANVQRLTLLETLILERYTNATNCPVAVNNTALRILTVAFDKFVGAVYASEPCGRAAHTARPVPDGVSSVHCSDELDDQRQSLHAPATGTATCSMSSNHSPAQNYNSLPQLGLLSIDSSAPSVPYPTWLQNTNMHHIEARSIFTVALPCLAESLTACTGAATAVPSRPEPRDGLPGASDRCCSSH